MPTEPTLTVADDADGTGGTATITGGDVGATHEAFTAEFNGDAGALSAWTSRGSIVGNGTIALNVGTGYFFCYVEASESGTFATTPPVYFNATTGDDAIMLQCLDGVKARLGLLTLAGISTDNIIVRTLPLEKGIGAGEVFAYPAILITPPPDAGLVMPFSEGTNRKDDVQYPVLVGVLDAITINKDVLTANQNRNYLWQQQIVKAFRNQRLTGVDEVYTTIVESTQITNVQAWRKGLFVSFGIFRFISREARGIT